MFKSLIVISLVSTFIYGKPLIGDSCTLLLCPANSTYVITKEKTVICVCECGFYLFRGSCHKREPDAFDPTVLDNSSPSDPTVLDPCFSFACPENSKCSLDLESAATCICQSGFVYDRIKNSCILETSSPSAPIVLETSSPSAPIVLENSSLSASTDPCAVPNVCPTNTLCASKNNIVYCICPNHSYHNCYQCAVPNVCSFYGFCERKDNAVYCICFVPSRFDLDCLSGIP